MAMAQMFGNYIPLNEEMYIWFITAINSASNPFKRIADHFGFCLCTMQVIHMIHMVLNQNNNNNCFGVVIVAVFLRQYAFAAFYL